MEWALRAGHGVWGIRLVVPSQGATGMIRIMLGGCALKSRNVRHSQSCIGGFRKSLEGEKHNGFALIML